MGITLDSIKAKMLGKTFGKLTILDYAGKSDYGDNLWRCKCTCGSEVIGRTAAVDKEKSACTKCKIRSGPKAIDRRTSLLGRVFGKLTVIGCEDSNINQQIIWTCLCECGNKISTRTSNLTTGMTVSCGCHRDHDIRPHPSLKHGLSNHPLYAIWAAMKDRCYNINNPRYADYGGRGIRVCESWRDDFYKFYVWAMSKGYEKGLTIERSNNHGHYEPGNCCWATPQEQVQNRRVNKVTKDKVLAIRMDPRVHSVIAKDYGVDESTISRIKGRKTWDNISPGSP